MTNDTDIPQDTEIHRLKIDESYKEHALERVRKIVRGNQCVENGVILKAFDGEVLQFKCETVLHIISKRSHKQVAGRTQGPVKVENTQAANEAMNKAYLSLANDSDIARKIKDVVLKRKDKGFALDNTHIDLPFWKKEFVIYDPCQTCRSSGSIQCQRCSGKGTELCPKCHGSGMDHCKHCHGQRMVMGPNNQKVQCPICHGNGRTGCTKCNQTGKITCQTCKRKGVTTCPACNGHAWNSDIHSIEIQARTDFDYPKKRLPEKVADLIESRGAKIMSDATITIWEDNQATVNSDDEDKQRRRAEEDEQKILRLPILYDVVLPYGHIEYDINGKSYYTFLFGKDGRLTHVSPFLDDLIKNGVRKLDDAAENRGNVGSNLEHAAQYRTLKEGISYSALYSLGKAAKALKKANPLGLSDPLLKHIIKTSDRALKNITKTPRVVGLGYAALCNAVLLGGYFLSPVRETLISMVPNTTVHIGFDLLAVFLAGYLGITTIQMTAQNALKRTLANILPKSMQKASTPKLGNIFYAACGMSVSIAALCLELTRHINGVAVPAWYASLF